MREKEYLRDAGPFDEVLLRHRSISRRNPVTTGLGVTFSLGRLIIGLDDRLKKPPARLNLVRIANDGKDKEVSILRGHSPLMMIPVPLPLKVFDEPLRHRFRSSARDGDVNVPHHGGDDHVAVPNLLFN